jgi:hypothetical protein
MADTEDRNGCSLRPVASDASKPASVAAASVYHLAVRLQLPVLGQGHEVRGEAVRLSRRSPHCRSLSISPRSAAERPCVVRTRGLLAPRLSQGSVQSGSEEVKKGDASVWNKVRLAHADLLAGHVGRRPSPAVDIIASALQFPADTRCIIRPEPHVRRLAVVVCQAATYEERDVSNWAQAYLKEAAKAVCF